MGIQFSCFFLGLVIGKVIPGWLTKQIGISNCLALIGAIGVLVSVMLFAIRRKINIPKPKELIGVELTFPLQ